MRNKPFIQIIKTDRGTNAENIFIRVFKDNGSETINISKRQAEELAKMLISELNIEGLRDLL